MTEKKDFESSLKYGYRSRRFLEKALETIGGTVSHRPDSWKLGVTMVWKYRGKSLRLLVKSERRHTGNLFAEMVSNRRTGALGWMQTSEADVLAYGFMPEGKSAAGYPDFPIWYFFSFARFRKHVENLVGISRDQWKLSRFGELGEVAVSETTRASKSGRGAVYSYGSEGLLINIENISIMAMNGPCCDGGMLSSLVMMNDNAGVWVEEDDWVAEFG